MIYREVGFWGRLWRGARWTGRMAALGVWHVFLRPADTLPLPRRLVRVGRVALVAAMLLSIFFVNRFSLSHRDEVFAALKHYGQRRWEATVRFEWAWRRIDLDALAREAAARHKIDERLVRAVIEVESGGRPYALSRTGACGLMQIMPSTARDLGEGNLFEPEVNVDLGARYLALLKKRFRGDTRHMLAAYNAGPGCVAESLRRHGDIPAIAETREYVRRVMARYRPEGPKIEAQS